MSSRLQDMSFKVSKYFRPLQKWQCGGLKNGKQCALGPDRNGQCRAMTSCEPDKKGNTWQCTRSELLGGKCTSGPSPHGECAQQRPPCTPVPNLYVRRFRAVALGVVTVSVLALSGLVFDFWRTTISAGPLSKHHASFGETDCVACHDIAANPRSRWLGAAFEAHTEQVVKKCTGCHSIGSNPANPHSLATPALLSLTRSITDNAALNGESEIAGPVQPMTGSLMMLAAQYLRGDDNAAPACTVCHQEHNGSDASIVQVSNQQCAVCHAGVFDNIGDHPDFINYPAERRTRIVFSHTSHLGKHFTKPDQRELAPQACTDCHTPDPVGQQMELAGFETSCAACHDDETRGEKSAGDKGFAVLSVPALDLEALQSRSVNIGQWPAQSGAELTPLQLMILGAISDKISDNFARVQTLDLADLSDATVEDLELVYEVAWRTKQFYFQLQSEGPEGVKQWLTKGRAEDMQPKVWGLLSPNLVDTTVQTAFPDLRNEVSRWLQAGQPAFFAKEHQAALKTTEAGPQTLDAPPDDDWLSSAAALDNASGQDEQVLDDDDWLNEALVADDAEALFDDDAEESGEEGWLSDAAGNSEVSDDEWLNEDEWGQDSEPEQENPLAESRPLEDRAAAGGWYLENFYLRYRPPGHADPLTVGWVDFLLDKPVRSPAVVSRMLAEFTSQTYPGSCFTCHSIENQTQQNMSALRVNWWGKKSEPGVYHFNRFSHRTHFKLAEQGNQQAAGSMQAGCQSCHRLNGDSDSAGTYQQNNVEIFDSDFFNLGKESCVDCHTERAALQSCSLCHNYHIGERGLTGLTARSGASDSQSPQ